ncbi:MAG: helix-turn-helix domain-containing protein [Candidatus Odinarchaeia archaeon]
MNLTDIFGQSAQVKMIDFLIKTEGLLMNLSEIARRTHLANSTVGRVVENLIKIGFLKEIKVGNMMRVVTLDTNQKITNFLIKMNEELKKIK